MDYTNHIIIQYNTIEYDYVGGASSGLPAAVLMGRRASFLYICMYIYIYIYIYTYTPTYTYIHID